MAFNISYVYKAVDRFSGPANKIKRSVSQLGDTLDQSSKSANRFSGALSKVGFAAKAAATLGVAIGIRNLAQYETALLGVAKTANIEVGPKLDKMGMQFRKISTQMPIGVTELLNFGQSAAQMGVVGEENILNFATTMAKLTKTTNIMGEEGAAQLARLINVTGGNIAEVEKYAATLVGLGNTSAATEAEILYFATQLAGAGALYGITGEQAMGLATAMRVLGIQSEVGSSTIGRALGVVNKAIGEGGRQMRFISKMTKIAGKDLKEAFTKDSVAVISKLGAGLEEFEKKGGDVVGALSFLNLQGIRDIRVLGSLAKNTELVTDKMNTANGAFKAGTALQKEYEIQSQSLNNQWILFKNTLNEVSLIITTKLMPVLKDVLSILTDITSAIGSVLKPITQIKTAEEISKRETTSMIAGSVPQLAPAMLLKTLNDYFNLKSEMNNMQNSHINAYNNFNPLLNGKIMVEAKEGSKVVSTYSKLKGMKGNLGLNYQNLGYAD